MHFNAKFFITFLAIFLSLSHICSSGYIHTMGEEEYSVITKLMKGEFNVPCSARTKLQKSAIIKYWRLKDFISVLRRKESAKEKRNKESSF